MTLELKAKPGCCEEASMASRDFYIPCNAPATRVLFGDNRRYRMCSPCADHNLRRGLHEVEVLPGELDMVKS